MEKKFPYDQSVYVKVYFFINAGYVWGEGMPDEKSFLEFSFDVMRILEALGFHTWQKSGSGSCFVGSRGCAERLYCHPMDLVGWVKKDCIDEIADALKSGKTFTLKELKTHEEALNYRVDELREALQREKVAIAARLLEQYKTKRRNLYKGYQEIKVGIRYVERAEVRGIEAGFINGVFEELLASGRLLKAEGERRLYRAASTRELAMLVSRAA